MGKNVEISLEVFGNRKVSSVFGEEELAGKNIGDIVNMMVHKDWSGEDKRTVNTIVKEMNATGGYVPEIGVGGKNLPVRFEPVRLNDDALQYAQQLSKPYEEIRITVLGDHKVGY
jgi:hypothetical protein